MNIAVLMGGLSPERNISMLSGRAVTYALRERGHIVTAFDPAKGANATLTDEDLAAATNAPVSVEELAALKKESLMEFIQSGLLDGVDVAFVLLHGHYGEDGYIQSLLELKGIPYTGSEMLASAIAMDKGLAKMLFQVSGIPTAYWVNVKPEYADDIEALEEIKREVNGPMVVKPNDGGSTVGQTIVSSGLIDDISKAIKEAAK